MGALLLRWCVLGVVACWARYHDHGRVIRSSPVYYWWVAAREGLHAAFAWPIRDERETACWDGRGQHVLCGWPVRREDVLVAISVDELYEGRGCYLGVWLGNSGIYMPGDPRVGKVWEVSDLD